jgi:hypothetical protein
MEFDVTMPLVLFVVTVAAMFLNKRIEGKMETAFAAREFRIRDAVLFVSMIIVAVTVIASVPEMAIMTVFMFSYSSLLFMFSYIFSNVAKRRAQLLCLVFGVAGLATGTVALQFPATDSFVVYGIWALYCLAAFAFFASLYEQKRAETRERWYLAVLPPALFLLLYLFYRGTPLWFPYFFNIFAITFAILITLYLSSLFKWKIVLIFAGLLTAMDIILVFGTGTMGAAATTLLDLSLPIAVVLPHIPIQGIISYGGLGLGDFFFAGLLTTQTHKKLGQKTAVIAALAMAISLGIFYTIQLYFQIQFFPATVNIICGWLPVVAVKLLIERRVKKTNANLRK